MSDQWNLPQGPGERRSVVARVGRPAALAAGGLLAGAVLAGTLSATAASNGSTPSPSSSSGSSSSAPADKPSDRGAANHTPVTGDELAKVTAAVTAKDSAVKVTSVRKDADGSYDVFGTSAGSQIRFEVSTDLKTITQGGGGHRGAGAGRDGGSADTAVTGDELAKVTAAMTAKDSTVTVTSVRKDSDGSYDVLGTKAGSAVMFDVSTDLKTFTQNTHGNGHGGGPKAGGTNDSAAPSSSAT